MQQKRISNTDGPITPAEYARLRDLNRSTISRQIQRGVIPTHDGLVDPKEADRCRAEGLHIRGRNTLRQRRERMAEEPQVETATLEQVSALCKQAFQHGQTNTADSLCRSIRQTFAPVIRDMDLPWIVAEDGGFRLRLGLITLLDYIVVGWCEELLTPGRLPDIDFREHFGPGAKLAKAWFESLQDYWRANSEDETAPLWPVAFSAEWPLDGPVPMPEVQPNKPKAPARRRPAKSKRRS